MEKLNQTSICYDEVILNICNSVSEPTENLFSYMTPFIPLVGIMGTISFFIYHNRPQIIEKKEVANYINSETDIRIHEYSFRISWGSDKIKWNYIPVLKEIKSMKVHKNTKLEFYYLSRNTGEEFVPEDCLKIKDFQKEKKISFVNIEKFKNNNIETIFLITKDKEESQYKSKIKERMYPNDSIPEKIEIVNENKVNIQNYEIIFTKQQTKKLTKRKIDYVKYLQWNNISISDCLIEDKKLKIILKQVPRNHGGLPGTIFIDLL